MKVETPLGLAHAAASILLFSLMIVWQIPGTIALRNVILVLLLLTSIWLATIHKIKFSQVFSFKRSVIICLLALSTWLVLGSVFWAADPGLSQRELIGQWVVPMLCGLTGALLAAGITSTKVQDRTWWIEMIFWALFLQVVLHILLDTAYWIQSGVIPFRQAPVLYLPEIIKVFFTGGSFVSVFTGESGDKFSYVSNTLAAIVVAELVQRVTLRKSWLPVNRVVLLLCFLAILISTYLLHFRNGSVGLLSLLGFALLMIFAKLAKKMSVRRLLVAGSFAFALFAFFGWALYKSDPRWQTLVETIPIALDTEHYDHWRVLDGTYPLLKDGTSVEPSAYVRFAWAKEGLKLLADNPFGTGYNRNAFGDGINKKYAMNGAYHGGHSHSGLIDFVIANGILGLLLWLSFMCALFYTGWVAFMNGQVAPGLMMMSLVSGFFSRSIVDSNIRDHVLQQFMFLVMLFAFLLIKPNWLYKND